MEQFMSFDGRLPIILHTVGESPHQNAVSRSERVKWNQFIWVKDGSGTFRSGDDTFLLEKGQGIFLRNSVSHSYEGKNLYTGWCTFSCAENLLNYVMGDKKHLVFSVPEFLDAETENLRSLAQSGADTLGLSAAAYTYVTELFAAITKNADPIISRSRKFMKKNFSKPITLDDIASSVDLDRFALCRYYQKHHKRSVMNELKAIRISAAKRLLRYSDESVGSISRLCGFENPSYFSLRFREECSCTPLEYRKKYM